MSRRQTTQGQILESADAPAVRTYRFDSCRNCGESSFTHRIRVYKCGACHQFFCSECWTRRTRSCPHCGAQDSGIYMGRA